jgi:ParB family chromosome partitioning protein
MSQFFNDAIFWIEVEKIKPNPYQPRREFDDAALRDLSESIKMYGILQPLVVTRMEVEKEDGGLAVEYELISGERRLRASKLAGLAAVPALIRNGEEDAQVKLELAIIENLQREDLNPVDRARAFERLIKEFGFKHFQVAEKVGRSREYVSNTMRILALPMEMLQALSDGKISEGHTRPLLMLVDRPEEQMTLFKEIMYKKMTVRESETISRKIAYDKVRKKERAFDPELMEIEQKFKDSLGTRVHIERSDTGGKLSIDFFSAQDLRDILDRMNSAGGQSWPAPDILERHVKKMQAEKIDVGRHPAAPFVVTPRAPAADIAIDDRPAAEIKKEQNTDNAAADEELYSLKNFVV